MNYTISQYARNKIENLFSMLTPKQSLVLDAYVSEWADPIKRIGGTTIDAETIGKLVNCSEKTVYRANAKFRELGLITTKKRFDNSNITKPTPWWRSPAVQSALPLFFSRYPIFRQSVLSIGLLLSLSAFQKTSDRDREKLSACFPDIKSLVIGNGINRSARFKGYQKGRFSIDMKQKIEKVQWIERGLVSRGEKEVIDRYKLMAFSDECLDYCIGKMKYAKPKYPYRFFLATAYEWCRYENKEPDYALAESLRLEGVFEPKEKTPKQERVKAVKRIEARKVTVAETAAQVRLDDPWTQWRIKDDLERLQKVGYDTEEGIKIRERLALMGVNAKELESCTKNA
jgi:hypothetical protein